MKLFLLPSMLLFLINNAALSQLVSKDTLYPYEESNSLIGKKLNSFSSKDVGGKTYSNKQLQNKIVFINFWFSDCTPCVAEFNAITNLYDKYKNNKTVLIITFTSDTKNVALKTKKKFKLKFPIIPISRDICYKLNFNNGFPTCFILNKQGKIVNIKHGNSTNVIQSNEEFKQHIIPKINKLLNDFL
jgi:thiol-disulfide isomerase/thioredoxin